jgi:hypothetical protein
MRGDPAPDSTAPPLDAAVRPESSNTPGSKESIVLPSRTAQTSSALAGSDRPMTAIMMNAHVKLRQLRMVSPLWQFGGVSKVR